MGALGRRLANAVIDRARAGVRVRVLLDAVGSKAAGEGVVRQMRAAGCRVVFFHDRRIQNIGVFNDRDHRKLTVVDRREAFVGDAIDAFGNAVARGVDVRVLMPSTSGSDNPMVQHAGHRNFEKLLRCGVRLFEYPHTLNELL